MLSAILSMIVRAHVLPAIGSLHCARYGYGTDAARCYGCLQRFVCNSGGPARDEAMWPAHNTT
eukprot:scaffold21595_cov41-Tisochrysis_lutea.AAC.1